MRRNAFTIVELLITMTIIGLLLGAVYLNVSASQTNARDSERLSDVSLIAQAIDRSIAINGGMLPTTTAPKQCADTLDQDLDLAPIPKDPLPVTPSTSCDSMLNGYTYHSHTGAGLADSYAKTQDVLYSLEVGLEREKPHDESVFHSPSELGLTGITSSPKRNRYILNGLYCGTTCP